MTGINLRQRRSESGIALVLTVSIIGVAFIVTVAAFLVGAAVSQDTERLAAAKVDIGNREDTLMRAILQQTATGMLPGTNGISGPSVNWTTIMTNAVNTVRATTYVDPTEVTTLLGAGMTAANTGDTGGTSLAIFQGYNQEIPFGGTSNLGNVLPLWNSTVQPPELSWSANPTLSATTALTYPQEMFLGSFYSGSRWSQMTYPNIRFGYKRPGDPFVARRVWWRIPVLYQTAQATVEGQNGVARYPSAPANYIISAYEIPSELPLSANASIQIGQNSDGTSWSTTAGAEVQITGSIYGDNVQLNGGTYSGGISSRQGVNVTSSATVAGETYSDNTYNNMGVRETRDLTRTTNTATIGAAPVSVAGDNGKVLFVPVMPGNDFYMAAPADSPTHWDLYARPFYRCGVRIIINSYDTNPIYSTSAGFTPISTAGAISVTVNVYPLIGSGPSGVLGVASSATGWTTQTFAQSAATNPGFTIVVPGSNALIYTTTNTGVAAQDRNVLQIDLSQLFTIPGLTGVLASNIYSVYVGYAPSNPPNTSSSTDIGVAITGATNLSQFTNGLSIVTKHRLYLLSPFNQGATQVPTSIYAPDIRYGISGVSPTTTVTGRISMGQALPGSSPAINPLVFSSGNNNTIAPASSTFVLSEATTAAMIPPITRLNLLFTIEKERTN
jgi:hypothetical protein